MTTRRDTTRRAAAAAVVALMAGCGRSSAPSPVAPPQPSQPTTTVAAAAATTTTVAVIAQQTPDLAATMLFTSWRAGDRTGALRVAAAGAVDTLFAHPPVAFSDRGCQSGLNGQSYCAFGVAGGLVQLLTVAFNGGWVVQTVTFDH